MEDLFIEIISESNSLQNLIRVSDISSISVLDNEVEIYISGQIEPLQVISASSKDEALEFYKKIIGIVPHNIVGTISF